MEPRESQRAQGDGRGWGREGRSKSAPTQTGPTQGCLGSPHKSQSDSPTAAPCEKNRAPASPHRAGFVGKDLYPGSGPPHSEGPTRVLLNTTLSFS